MLTGPLKLSDAREEIQAFLGDSILLCTCGSLSVCLSVSVSVSVSVCVSLCLSVHPSVRPSVCLFFSPSLHWDAHARWLVSLFGVSMQQARSAKSSPASYPSLAFGRRHSYLWNGKGPRDKPGGYQHFPWWRELFPADERKCHWSVAWWEKCKQRMY